GGRGGARGPGEATPRVPSRAALRGVAIARGRLRLRRDASSAKGANGPGANASRWEGMSWIKGAGKALHHRPGGADFASSEIECCSNSHAGRGRHGSRDPRATEAATTTDARLRRDED